jgi:hypothetical protein
MTQQKNKRSRFIGLAATELREVHGQFSIFRAILSMKLGVFSPAIPKLLAYDA